MPVGKMSSSLVLLLRGGIGGGDSGNVEAGENLGVTKPALNASTAARRGKCRGRGTTMPSKEGESCREGSRKGLEEAFGRIWRASWGGCFSLAGLGKVQVSESCSVLGSVSSSTVTAFFRVKW